MESKNEAILIQTTESPRQMPEALKKRMQQHEQNKSVTTLDSIKAKQVKAQNAKKTQVDEQLAKTQLHNQKVVEVSKNLPEGDDLEVTRRALTNKLREETMALDKKKTTDERQAELDAIRPAQAVDAYYQGFKEYESNMSTEVRALWEKYQTLL